MDAEQQFESRRAEIEAEEAALWEEFHNMHEVEPMIEVMPAADTEI